MLKKRRDPLTGCAAKLMSFPADSSNVAVGPSRVDARVNVGVCPKKLMRFLLLAFQDDQRPVTQALH